MTLSLVVPVCNDIAGARQVVGTACDLGIFSQIILSDDASQTAFSVDDVLPADRIFTGDIQVLRTADNRGAGHARNRALEHVTGRHVLFFDADDILRPDFASLWARVKEQEFDFCIFHHIEERTRAGGHIGMFAKDNDLWDKAGAQHILTSLAPEHFLTLAQVAAYPWNKIYRTAFLRDQGVRCGETVVHNDIELHWVGFLKAKRILCSRIQGCEHVLGTARNHLTHRSGVERLQLFDALNGVVSSAGPLTQDWAFAYACFYLDLLDWAAPRVADEFQDEFSQKAQAFMECHLDGPLLVDLNQRSPDLARRAMYYMAGER